MYNIYILRMDIVNNKNNLEPRLQDVGMPMI